MNPYEKVEIRSRRRRPYLSTSTPMSSATSAIVSPGAVTIEGTLVAALGSLGAKCPIIAPTAGNIDTIARIGRNPARTTVIPWAKPALRSPASTALIVLSPRILRA